MGGFLNAHASNVPAGTSRDPTRISPPSVPMGTSSGHELAQRQSASSPSRFGLKDFFYPPSALAPTVFRHGRLFHSAPLFPPFSNAALGERFFSHKQDSV